MSGPSIHIISTVNGQVNEGMRNVATHLARAFEAEHTVRYSGLKSLPSILRFSLSCDLTMIFARANRMVYWLGRIVGVLSRNVWIVCVQKPDADFFSLVKKHPLKANYLSILEHDLDEVVLRPGCRKETLPVGIQTDKFRPVNGARQAELKAKYGLRPDRPLVLHVGHCSSGRGLEDFTAIEDAERLIVASGMFENPEAVRHLEEAGVRIQRGYMEHVEEMYQMADVYFFPTRSAEYVISVPLSVMEALSCGVPVVGYRDFENLRTIPAVENAVTLIGCKAELNSAIRNAADKKRAESFLTHPVTWEQAAQDVLAKVTGRRCI